MMKKFIDTLEEIKAYNGAISSLEKEAEKINAEYKELFSGMSFKEKKEYKLENEEKIKAMEEKLIRVYGAENDLKIMVRLAKNNGKVALYHEVLPVALEILKKYNGKPYGTKTREKISKEVEEATGCRFYISCNYSSTYHFYPKNHGYDIEVIGKYIDGESVKLLIDNKIQAVTMEELKPVSFYDEYIEDLNGRVEELKRLHKLAKEKEEELKEICSQFNNLKVEGIDSLSTYNGIRHYLI